MTDVGGMFQITHYNHGGPARAAVVFHHQDVTMVRTLKICFVDPDPIRTRAFLRAHLRGGLWYLLAREYYPTGFIGVRIFGNREIPGMFVLIEIWTSTESLEAARRTPAVFVLERFQRNLTISTLDCGAFQVSTSTSEHPVDQAEFAQADTAVPITERRTPPPESDTVARGDSAHHSRTRARLEPMEAFYEISDLSLHLALSVQRRDP